MKISISVYSILSAIIFFNIGLSLMVILRHKTSCLQKYTVESLFFLFALSSIRLLVPLDSNYAFVLESRVIIPEIQKILGTYVVKDITVGRILAVFWLAGIVIKCACIANTSYKMIIETKKYSKIECAQVKYFSELSYYKNVEIVVTPDVLVPIVTGVIRPHIFLPVSDVTDIELDMILKHEIQHIENGDIFIKLLFSFLEALFWWNPFVNLFGKELEYLLELRCDKSVTSKMSTEQREIYCFTLIKVAKQAMQRVQEYKTMVLSFSKSRQIEIIRQRIEIMLHDRKGDAVTQRKVRYILLFIFLLSYLVVIQPYYSIPDKENIGIMEITPDNAYIKKDPYGTYKLFINGEEAHELETDDLKIEPYYSLEIIGEATNAE